MFGLALTKGEAISWYRIQEMFRFESFHMFGIFMTAIPTGAAGLFIIRETEIKNDRWPVNRYAGKKISSRNYHWKLDLWFWMGIDRCVPGTTVRTNRFGYSVVIVTLLSAILGTWTYGRFQKYLPD